ncbi:EVE domain-containing protein [Paenibacillus sp. MMS18-CY102]|uniref:EVE domain-containing protein n=1 Tax=Paenibacillus sp. MMS18-CY102 TaxID=2682849 RepID=UPI0013660570|nr:EVE domain-containing protein [Paenibacillus sp. MMS18-CY102]MWC29646.1 EVE domain-containing protein [Paenibacillus sp. MMS18-CY102]
MGDNNRTRYWIGVVSRSHVMRGVAGGFAQLCHGKAASLKRMREGDWLIYYSPKTDMEGGVPLQAFTAIGRVRNALVYEYAMSETFVPSRRDIDFYDCTETPIHSLLDQMIFTRENRRNWGYRFRTGHFEIDAADFAVIATAMNIEGAGAQEIAK